MLITLRVVLDRPRIAFTSASTSIRSLPSTTFATSSSADDAAPAIPTVVVDAGRDQAGDERPVALLVVAGGAADERLRVGDLADEVGMVAVDAGVDHGDADRRQASSASPRSRTSCRTRDATASARAVVRGVSRAAAAEPLDVDGTGKIAQPRWARALDHERRNRRQALGAGQLRPEAREVAADAAPTAERAASACGASSAAATSTRRSGSSDLDSSRDALCKPCAARPGRGRSPARARSGLVALGSGRRLREREPPRSLSC